MNKNQQQQPPGYRVRGSDRRIGTATRRPPYMTCGGLVDHDRRSPFDRRATWLREFSIDVASV